MRPRPRRRHGVHGVGLYGVGLYGRLRSRRPRRALLPSAALGLRCQHADDARLPLGLQLSWTSPRSRRARRLLAIACWTSPMASPPAALTPARGVLDASARRADPLARSVGELCRGHPGRKRAPHLWNGSARSAQPTSPTSADLADLAELRRLARRHQHQWAPSKVTVAAAAHRCRSPLWHPRRVGGKGVRRERRLAKPHRVSHIQRVRVRAGGRGDARAVEG